MQVAERRAGAVDDAQHHLPTHPVGVRHDRGPIPPWRTAEHGGALGLGGRTFGAVASGDHLGEAGGIRRLRDVRSAPFDATAHRLLGLGPHTSP